MMKKNTHILKMCLITINHNENKNLLQDIENSGQYIRSHGLDNNIIKSETLFDLEWCNSQLALTDLHNLPEFNHEHQTENQPGIIEIKIESEDGGTLAPVCHSDTGLDDGAYEPQGSVSCAGTGLDDGTHGLQALVGHAYHLRNGGTDESYALLTLDPAGSEHRNAVAYISSEVQDCGEIDIGMLPYLLTKVDGEKNEKSLLENTDMLQRSSSGSEAENNCLGTKVQHYVNQQRIAFMIFCKRNRQRITQKYPHLKGSGVSSILRDLWTTIGEEERMQYTNLAQQYNEAFKKAYRNSNQDKTEKLDVEEDLPMDPNKTVYKADFEYAIQDSERKKKVRYKFVGKKRKCIKKNSGKLLNPQTKNSTEKNDLRFQQKEKSLNKENGGNLRNYQTIIKYKKDNYRVQQKKDSLKLKRMKKFKQNKNSFSFRPPDVLIGTRCVECKKLIQNENHFRCLPKCSSCNYKTYCCRSFADHMIIVHGQRRPNSERKAPKILPSKFMVCECGFIHYDGNKVASHLAECEVGHICTGFSSVPSTQTKSTVEEDPVTLRYIIMACKEPCPNTNMNQKCFKLKPITSTPQRPARNLQAVKTFQGETTSVYNSKYVNYQKFVKKRKKLESKKLQQPRNKLQKNRLCNELLYHNYSLPYWQDPVYKRAYRQAEKIPYLEIRKLLPVFNDSSCGRRMYILETLEETLKYIKILNTRQVALERYKNVLMAKQHNLQKTLHELQKFQQEKS